MSGLRVSVDIQLPPLCIGYDLCLSKGICLPHHSFSQVSAHVQLSPLCIGYELCLSMAMCLSHQSFPPVFLTRLSHQTFSPYDDRKHQCCAVLSLPGCLFSCQGWPQLAELVLFAVTGPNHVGFDRFGCSGFVCVWLPVLIVQPLQQRLAITCYIPGAVASPCVLHIPCC